MALTLYTHFRFPIQKHTKLNTPNSVQSCKPCLRLKTLKIIPCSAAHIRLSQISEYPVPPGDTGPGKEEVNQWAAYYTQLLRHMSSDAPPRPTQC